ncbi:hypothetical protein [Algoriphagus mannitolivorans]|uniref:hypothetical protein n=1 Tax=Algoriphagus mannitolivorans TaxID=226504 RepID=UPI000429F394|nr:hypothetical protein [Algoriphagus mannitolivorans]
MRTIGIILIIVGAAMFFLTGIDFTTKEKVIDAGPIQISAEKENRLEWPTYAGGIVIAAGIIMVLVGKKK